MSWGIVPSAPTRPYPWEIFPQWEHIFTISCSHWVFSIFCQPPPKLSSSCYNTIWAMFSVRSLMLFQEKALFMSKGMMNRGGKKGQTRGSCCFSVRQMWFHIILGYGLAMLMRLLDLLPLVKSNLVWFRRPQVTRQLISDHIFKQFKFS